MSVRSAASPSCRLACWLPLYRCRAKGSNIQEGPGLNIARIEKNGRTFEYISGEDPILGGQLGVRVVAGIQKNVMAIAKHYILNNQETDRSGGNMIADEKTIMELYAPPFEAVAATVAGYMCRSVNPPPPPDQFTLPLRAPDERTRVSLEPNVPQSAYGAPVNIAF